MGLTTTGSFPKALRPSKPKKNKPLGKPSKPRKPKEPKKEMMLDKLIKGKM